MRAILGILAVAVAIAGGGSAWAIDEIYTGRFSSVALGGHDVVAYFTESRPIEGSSEFEYPWKGATWRFASRKNLEAFQADPEAYRRSTPATVPTRRRKHPRCPAIPRCGGSSIASST